MDPLFKKLNFKEQSQILVLNAPESFNKHLDALVESIEIIKDINVAGKIEFVISFVTRKQEIDEQVPMIVPKLVGDAFIWFCYPKGNSKNYTCDFNRDTGWDILGEKGFEGVRMVAIDQDWSALRFRNTAYIKKMTRRKSFAMSKEGKQKQKGSNSTNSDTSIKTDA